MNHSPLIYFFPNRQGIPGYIPEWRRDMLGTKSSLHAIGPGSDGKEGRGQLFSWVPDAHLHYNPDRQRWTRFRSGDEYYWIGIDKDANSSHFKREKTIPGSLVRLQHGYWEIPIANPLVETCQLPYYDVPSGDGNWMREFYEDYIDCSHKAIELAGIARELLLKSTQSDTVKMEIEDDDYREYVRIMINVNYNLTLEEMGALHLFDQNKYQELLFAFIDLPEMVSMMTSEMEAAKAPLNPTAALLGGNDMSSGSEG